MLFDRFSFADNLALKHHNKRAKLEGGEAYIRMQFCFKIDEPPTFGLWLAAVNGGKISSEKSHSKFIITKNGSGVSV